MDRPPGDFFPSYERLRSVFPRLTPPKPFPTDKNLLDLEPVATSGMAAVVLQTSMLVRREWSEEVELPPSVFEKVASDPPRVPRGDDPLRFEKRDHRYHTGSIRRASCTLCFERSGWVTCGVCAGRGVAPDYLDVPAGTPCSVCSAGYVRCHVCEGAGACSVVNMHYATDSPIIDRRVIVPSLVGDVDDKLRNAIREVRIPDDFLIDLQPSMVASAYRGTMSVAKPNLFGFDYLDAWDIARVSQPRPAPNTILREDHAWGWPFLCVRWELDGKNVDVGIVANEHGVWRAVFSTPGVP